MIKLSLLCLGLATVGLAACAVMLWRDWVETEEMEAATMGDILDEEWTDE